MYVYLNLRPIITYLWLPHYGDVIINAMASQITGVSIVYSNVCSCTNQRKHQCSASLAFVRRIHGSSVNSPHKGPVTGTCFQLMKSSWIYKLVLWCSHYMEVCHFCGILECCITDLHAFFVTVRSCFDNGFLTIELRFKCTFHDLIYERRPNIISSHQISRLLSRVISLSTIYQDYLVNWYNALDV